MNSLGNIPENEIINGEMMDCPIMDDPDLMEKLVKAKKSEPSKFESFWEKDENDIEGWTEAEIQNDERKQLVTYAEESYDLVYELLYRNGRSIDSQRDLLTYRDSDGYTALHRAAYSSQLDIVKLLISFESQINDLNLMEKRTDMGWTPLHSASYWNAYQVVEFFLKRGHGDPNAQSNGGQTPLHLVAQKSDCMETVLMLLTHHSVDFTIKNDQNETALEIARRSSQFNHLFEIAEESLNVC